MPGMMKKGAAYKKGGPVKKYQAGGAVPTQRPPVPDIKGSKPANPPESRGRIPFSSNVRDPFAQAGRRGMPLTPAQTPAVTRMPAGGVQVGQIIPGMRMADGAPMRLMGPPPKPDIKGSHAANPPESRRFREGGQVRGRSKAPSFEEDMTPPRGMRNFRSNAQPSDIPPSRTQAPTYEEDMTPPRGMRNFRSNAVPSNEPLPGRRMKKGGVVKKKAGGMIPKKKAK